MWKLLSTGNIKKNILGTLGTYKGYTSNEKQLIMREFSCSWVSFAADIFIIDNSVNRDNTKDGTLEQQIMRKVKYLRLLFKSSSACHWFDLAIKTLAESMCILWGKIK